MQGTCSLHRGRREGDRVCRVHVHCTEGDERVIGCAGYMFTAQRETRG